ncbi:MAG: hypothetical protein WD939_02995 [Dehalococcoidia bacterium]
MPKLRDLIQRSTRADPAPLGFASQRSKSAPSIVLVASIGKDWKKGVANAAAAGADACLLTNGPAKNDIADAVAAADGRPCGLLDGPAEAGLDFIVLGTDAPASLLQDDELGRVLLVPADLTDIQLRTMESLAVDALYLDQTTPDTILGQMELRRVSGLARRPLLVPAPAEASQDALLSLRDAGGALLAVDATGGTGELSRLRALVDALPRRKRGRHEGGPEVTVPSAAAHDHDHDDDDEE